MDVLELPRPVINFLRTMAKESCRYALSWDIFGGPDSVTLTLTWKLIDDESQSSMINEASPSSSSSKHAQAGSAAPIYDDARARTRPAVKHTPLSSSPRRSRRDENENASVPAIFRSSRGKSLEGNSVQSTKTHSSSHRPAVAAAAAAAAPPSSASHHHSHAHSKDHHHHQQQQHVSSLERTPLANHYHPRPKKDQPKSTPTQSDQIYSNLYDTRSSSVVKCATVSSLSSSSPSPQPNNNPPLSIAHTHHKRVRQQQPPVTPPTPRKTLRPLTTKPSRAVATPPTPTSASSNYAKLRRTNHIATPDDDDESDNDDAGDDDDEDEDALDPWVKRFECSLEENDQDESNEHFDDKDTLATTTTTSPAASPSVDTTEDSGLTSGKVKFKTKPDYF